MDAGSSLNERTASAPDPALLLRVLELQRLVAELLEKNEELREALARAAADGK